MHYGHPFSNQSGRKWYNKSRSRQRERQKLSHGGQQENVGGTRGRRVQSEHQEATEGCFGVLLDRTFLQEDTGLVKCGCPCFTVSEGQIVATTCHPCKAHAGICMDTVYKQPCAGTLCMKIMGKRSFHGVPHFIALQVNGTLKMPPKLLFTSVDLDHNGFCDCWLIYEP